MSLRAFHILRLRLPHRRLLTKLMYVVRMHSNSGSMQALSHSTFAVVVTHSVHFHADVRASLAHLAIVILQQHGTSFTKPQVEEFASKSEALLLGAGQYLLQSNLMCLLEAYCQSSSSASRVMASLESRFCKLEPDISCSPAPGVPARPSPRKLLNTYNVFHQGASSVISVLPLEQRLFGHRPNQVRPLRGGSRRVLCPSLASLPPAPPRRPRPRPAQTCMPPQLTQLRCEHAALLRGLGRLQPCHARLCLRGRPPQPHRPALRGRPARCASRARRRRRLLEALHSPGGTSLLRSSRRVLPPLPLFSPRTFLAGI